MRKVHGTPYALRAERIEERLNMRMLVKKIWFLMSEMNRGPGYHIYHCTGLPLKKTKRVGQMDDFRIQN